MTVNCRLCGKEMKTRINGSHLLRSHNITISQYKEKFPDQDVGTRKPTHRFVVSKIDGVSRTLPQHTNHCRLRGLSPEEYYSKYSISVINKCKCGCGGSTSFINVLDGYKNFSRGHGSNDSESIKFASVYDAMDLCTKNGNNFTKKFKQIYKNQWNSEIKKETGKNDSEKIYKHFYPDSGKCEICGEKNCRYRSFVVGYWPTCGYKCALIKDSRDNYGVDNRFQSQSVKDVSQKTMKDKYGVDNPCEIHVRWKEYKMPSGKTIKYQGYENLALDLLLSSGIDESEIFIEKKTQPKIFYLYNGKKCRYYMDLYIKNLNKIVEVKSDWTYKVQKDKNEAKKLECLNRGYDFEFWIFNKKKELTIL